jgi:methyl-accepting chemotaxis protein
LVGGISAGSKEQSEGINQANKAMGDMDNVAQQNAPMPRNL